MSAAAEGRTSTVARLTVAVWALTALVGFCILLLPEKNKEPLVPRDGWAAGGAFVPDAQRPHPWQVSDGILKHPQSVFWTSWRSDPLGEPGRLVSAHFRAPAVLAVPFSGFPSQAGGELYLECIESREKLRIAHGNAHYAWVERTIWLPASWCRSESRLVASSTGQRPSMHIAVGTPFTSSRLAWLKESVFVAVFLHALACALLFVPGLAFAWLAGARRVETAVAMTLPATFLLGYLVFFGFYYGAPLMRFGVFFGMMGSLIVVLAKWRPLLAWVNHSASATVCRLFFGLSLAYVLLLYAADLGVGPYAANYRFAPAVWSTDNQVPPTVAEALYQETSLKHLIGRWRVSDRPPLMSGLFLLARPVWAPLKAIGGNDRLLFYHYQIAGIVASTLWVIPIWLLLVRSAARSARQASLVVIAVATTGLVVFNSVFIWPKMLAGAFALGAYLAHPAVADNGRAQAVVGEAAVGLLIALALLSHGGVVFGLVPLFVVFALHRTADRIRGVVLPLVVAGVVLVPWLLWQRFEDPPGNALVKYALAGTYGFGEESKSLVATVRDVYSGLSLGSWLSLRGQAVLTLFGAFQPAAVGWLWSQPMDFLGQVRLADFVFVFPSLRLGNFGWLVFAVALLRGRRDSAPIAEALFARWVLIGVAGVALNALVMWAAHVNWTESYVSLLLIITGLYSALLLTNASLRGWLLAGQFAYFAVVWWWSPLSEVPWRYDHVAGWLITVVSLWFALPADNQRREDAGRTSRSRCGAAKLASPNIRID
jgi:hypothetical protein